MSPRERVLTALNHHEPDRPPLDLSGHRSSGIAALAYARLRRYLGLPERPLRVYDPVAVSFWSAYPYPASSNSSIARSSLWPCQSS
jgi:hypothetical protein